MGNINETTRSQSIDLKIPLNIPGVTSSENYYRMNQIDIENKKLKKKMKIKENKKKNKNTKNEDDEDEPEGPLVKVLPNEMPEGVLDDSDDDMRKNRSLNDPHRALDINLDELVYFLLNIKKKIEFEKFLNTAGLLRMKKKYLFLRIGHQKK